MLPTISGQELAGLEGTPHAHCEIVIGRPTPRRRREHRRCRSAIRRVPGRTAGRRPGTRAWSEDVKALDRLLGLCSAVLRALTKSLVQAAAQVLELLDALAAVEEQLVERLQDDRGRRPCRGDRDRLLTQHA